jgi:hypothetical protein
MDFKDLDLSGLDEPLNIPHEFEIDLNCVVTANHDLTLKAIDRSEDEELAKIDDNFPQENYETLRSITGHMQNFFQDLREAARRLAFVGLVTRLQHWIGRFLKQAKVKPDKVYDSQLANQIAALNKFLGVGPVPEMFFEDLAMVRDSVIHADSRAEWKYRSKPRRVADHYRNAGGDVELTEEQLQEAIKKASQQVRWYDERLNQ